MKEKIKLFFRKLRKNVIEYIATNRLFLAYVILAMAGLMLVRNFTVNNMWSFEAFICDLALVLMFGSLGYLVKPKNQYLYFNIQLTSSLSFGRFKTFIIIFILFHRLSKSHANTNKSFTIVYLYFMDYYETNREKNYFRIFILSSYFIS